MLLFCPDELLECCFDLVFATLALVGFQLLHFFTLLAPSTSFSTPPELRAFILLLGPLPPLVSPAKTYKSLPFTSRPVLKLTFP